MLHHSSIWLLRSNSCLSWNIWSAKEHSLVLEKERCWVLTRLQDLCFGRLDKIQLLFFAFFEIFLLLHYFFELEKVDDYGGEAENSHADGPSIYFYLALIPIIMQKTKSSDGQSEDDRVEDQKEYSFNFLSKELLLVDTLVRLETINLFKLHTHVFAYTLESAFSQRPAFRQNWTPGVPR